MAEYRYRPFDFDNPSKLFIIEDLLKDLLGGPLVYTKYYRSLELKGDEKVLDLNIIFFVYF